jgi:Ca-activated chloride channel family protein
MDFRFEHISFLFGLVLVPFLIIVFAGVLLWKKKTRLKIGNAQMVKELAKNYSSVKFVVKFILTLLALTAIIAGSANLQKRGSSDNLVRKGVDVMIAIDVSNSMMANDVSPNRLERTKQLVYKVMEKMPNDRMGLILFAGRAYLQMPLTNDHSAARMYIQNASPDIVPVQGTVIAEALKVGVNAFNTKERKYKSILLISDGEDHDPEAIELSKAMAQSGVMINTVGIGSAQGIPLIDPATRQTRKDAQGNAIITKLNEAELQQLAQNTNGLYLLLQDTNEAAKTIVEKLSTAAEAISGDRSLANYTNYFFWFLIAGLLLLLLEFFIPERKMNTV